jgi:2-haloacid dehalogenase
VKTVAFDLNGTLFDPAALADPLGGRDADRELVLQALDDAIGQAMASTLAGAYPQFPELLVEGLERRLHLAGREESLAKDAAERTSAMQPSPERPQALDRLTDAGFRLAVVTNSATESAQQTLEQAGVLDRFALVMGTDAVEAYKPDQRATRRRSGSSTPTRRTSGSSPRTGGTSSVRSPAWVSRKEGKLMAPLGDADVKGADLFDVAQAIAQA